MAAATVAAMVAAHGCGGAPGTPDNDAPPKVSARPITRVPIEEPEEDDDGVQVVSKHGRMEPSVVDAGIEPYKERLFECYTSQVGRRRWLGGHVALQWQIKANGEVKAVKVSESDLGAWAIEKCLLEVAREATFDKPIGGDATFTIPLDFTLKGTLISWDEDTSLKATQSQLPKLDACAKGKVRMPNDVTITVYVGARGKPQSVGFSSPKTVLEDEWAECAEKAVLAWKLPDPKGQVAKLAVRYR
ncbi:MAG: TonB family protein [Kofleriaceae bacterium]